MKSNNVAQASSVDSLDGPTTELITREAAQTTEEQVSGYLERLLPVVLDRQQEPIAALVPWICDVLLSEHSLKAYGKDLAQFIDHMASLNVAPLKVTADHVKIYKAALLKSGVRATSVARKLSVIRGAYRQFADKELVGWPIAQSIAAIKAPPVKKNSTPALTQKQAVSVLEAVPTNSLQGVRDFAMLQTFFITGCRVSAICGARVGDLEFDGVEHYLHVTEKRGKEARKILLDATRPIFAYLETAGISQDREGPLFRPMDPNSRSFIRRWMHRKTPWRLVKKYCREAGIDPDRLTGRGIGVHSLRKTAITDAIRNGANMHEVREFAGHSDIRTTELYYQRRDEDADLAARRIQIRVRGK